MFELGDLAPHGPTADSGFNAVFACQKNLSGNGQSFSTTSDGSNIDSQQPHMFRYFHGEYKENKVSMYTREHAALLPQVLGCQ